MADDYEIDAVVATHEQTAGGGLVDVMEVSFHTEPEGATGFVRVPLTASWETAATAAILQQVAAIRALLGA